MMNAVFFSNDTKPAVQSVGNNQQMLRVSLKINLGAAETYGLKHTLNTWM